ncbi:hypothetical protein MANES_12G082400v8 [Manihot esculenta]|uniref:Uncharacterized protein n=1 Tax=Manihot esculenta TaxID=3983 RepID=A0A2C9UUW1_MANES|nr:hypothetical protein MANES_12G082400v8 [Manihot esculenta]
MSWKSRAWTAVGSAAAVEELKDNKLCKLKSLHRQHLHNKKVSMSTNQVEREFSPTSNTNSEVELRREGNKQQLNQSAEETLRTVMYLSCWGPNS